MEVCGINGPTTSHQSRRKCILDNMLIVNAFVEFGDLMYSVGRIEDGIKRENRRHWGKYEGEKKNYSR